jgi:hypothetical protein
MVLSALLHGINYFNFQPKLQALPSKFTCSVCCVYREVVPFDDGRICLSKSVGYQFTAKELFGQKQKSHGVLPSNAETSKWSIIPSPNKRIAAPRENFLANRKHRTKVELVRHHSVRCSVS